MFPIGGWGCGLCIATESDCHRRGIFIPTASVERELEGKSRGRKRTSKFFAVAQKNVTSQETKRPRDQEAKKEAKARTV